MNKILLAVIILAVGVAAGWFYFKGISPASPSKGKAPVIEISPTASAMVSYTDSGFSPKSVTVKKGTTVSFRNDSSGNMWVASGVHPTHLLLPGFDELTSITNGGTYQYTFVKVGTWQYHNHVKPTDVAFVVVTE